MSDRAMSLDVLPGYTSLADVLADALNQAQAGKGKERHSCGEPFEEQQIVVLNEKLGSIHGQVFQACKKAIEAARLPSAPARRELLGAINYLAAAVIQIDRRIAEEERRRTHYMRHVDECQAQEDWHGVQDAGSDLRDITQRIEALRWVLCEDT